MTWLKTILGGKSERQVPVPDRVSKKPFAAADPSSGFRVISGDAARREAARLRVTSDATASVVILIFESSAKNAFLIDGSATCHGCRQSVAFEIEGGLGLVGGSATCKCGNRLGTMCCAHDEDKAKHFVIVSPQTSLNGARLYPIEVFVNAIKALSSVSETPKAKAQASQQPGTSTKVGTVPQTLKAFADSVRKSAASFVQLNQMGVAEKDQKRATVYYLAALERKPGEKQVLSNLEFVQTKGVNLDEIRSACGFSPTDALPPTAFSCATLEAPPPITDENKGKAKELFRRAHEAPFGSSTQLKTYLDAVLIDPNLRGAWNEFGMLAARAGRFDLADKCAESVRVLDAGKFLNEAHDLLGQAPL